MNQGQQPVASALALNLGMLATSSQVPFQSPAYPRARTGGRGDH